MEIILKTGKALLGVIYAFMKLSPVKNRIVFISRQENRPSMDISMLAEKFREDGYETVILCRTLDPGFGNTVSYAFHMLKQMKLIATSRVVILDSYCIVACLLKHRQETVIIQMWHALGSMKKFGYSILDMPEGRSSRTAKLMNMHGNYDHIFTSSQASRPYFAEAFGYPEEKLTVMSLPRVDVLRSEEWDRESREAVFRKYPQLQDDSKQNILYAPTLRRGSDMTEAMQQLIDAVDYEKYNLIVKFHPVAARTLESDRAIVDQDFETISMYSVADFIITDYSALTYEVAIKEIPLYFYAFDHDEYMKGRNFYMDYDREMPGDICTGAEQVMEAIARGGYDTEREKQFAARYVEKQEGCTDEIAAFAEEFMK